MSIGLMQAVWSVGPTDATEAAVMLALANFAGDDGGNCFPSIELIAKMARYSTRTVIRAVAALEAAGWVKVERGSGRGLRSQYELNTDRLLTLHGEHLQSTAKGVRLSRFSKEKGCQNVTVPKKQKGDTETRKGDTQTQKGDTDGLLIRKNRQEPSLVSNTPTQTLPVGGLQPKTKTSQESETPRKLTGLDDGPPNSIMQHGRQPRAPRQTAAERARAATAMIGAAAPVTPMRDQSHPLSSADVRAGVKRALAAVRESIADTYATHKSFGNIVPDDYVAEWDQAMDRVEYERHETPEGRSSGLVVVLTSPVPRATAAMVKSYETRIETQMRVQLASRVQLQVISAEEVAA